MMNNKRTYAEALGSNYTGGPPCKKQCLHYKLTLIQDYDDGDCDIHFYQFAVAITDTVICNACRIISHNVMHRSR